jgi:hypothetical protein
MRWTGHGDNCAAQFTADTHYFMNINEKEIVYIDTDGLRRSSGG